MLYRILAKCLEFVACEKRSEDLSENIVVSKGKCMLQVNQILIWPDLTSFQRPPVVCDLKTLVHCLLVICAQLIDFPECITTIAILKTQDFVKRKNS